MLAVKAIRLEYQPCSETIDLLERYKEMVNTAILVGLERKITSRFKLIEAVYEDFKRYGLHTHYVLNACEIACAIIKNHRKQRRKPYVRKLILKLDNQTYKIENGMLRIPVKPREFIKIPLRFRDYHKRFLEDRSLKRGSVTIT